MAGIERAQPARPGYFDIAFYRQCQDLVRSWRELTLIPAERVPPEADRLACEAVLKAEARLIDCGNLTAWLDLYTDDGIYWIPTDVEGADPSRVVSWEFNDRRRVEERVERLATGRAFSQIPATRTTHVYSNYEMMTAGPDTMEVLCQFIIDTSLRGHRSTRSGWNGFVLHRTKDGWRIAMKRVSLFDADEPQDNNSFTL